MTRKKKKGDKGKRSKKDPEDRFVCPSCRTTLAMGAEAFDRMIKQWRVTDEALADLLGTARARSGLQALYTAQEAVDKAGAGLKQAVYQWDDIVRQARSLPGRDYRAGPGAEDEEKARLLATLRLLTYREPNCGHDTCSAWLTDATSARSDALIQEVLMHKRDPLEVLHEFVEPGTEEASK